MIEKNIEYSTDIRKDVEEKFKINSNEDLKIFTKLLALSYEIDSILKDKFDSKSKEVSKEYYTALINIRTIDHFNSATLLFNKGYTIDAITLVRSALEDLWIIENFWLNDSYFQKWVNGCEIKPGELRNYSKIDEKTRTLYNNIYKALCDISHCRIHSIHQLAKFHPMIKIKEDKKYFNLSKDYKLVISSFYIYLIRLVKVISDYIEDKKFSEIQNALDETSKLIFFIEK